RLVLIGRTPLPPRPDWSAITENAHPADPVARRIRMILSLEALGCEVRTPVADVADLEAMRQLVADVLAEFGRVDGVIHAAGEITGETFTVLPEVSEEKAMRQFGSKVRGLMHLEALLADQMLDFFVLTSSMSAVLGGLGFTSYAAANAFLDGYARAKNRRLAA